MLHPIAGQLINTRYDIGSTVAEKKLPWLSRIYIWSLAFEPLLFFILFENAISSLSRIFQIIVLIGLILRLFLIILISQPQKIKLPNITSSLYRNYGIYIVIAYVAGVVGFITGAYELPTGFSYEADISGGEKWLNSETIRPFFEYIISIYYFGYFVILPSYLMKNERSIEYFFSVFKTFFIFCLIVGLIDFGLSCFGIFLVPRHFVDWRMVGVRFHGLAGEPRHAFAYLFLGLAILHLKAYYKGVNLSRWWIGIIIVLAALTQSASGLLGVAFFLGLYGLYNFRKLNVNRLIRLFVLSGLTITLIYEAAVNSERIMQYVNAASNLWEILESKGKVPELIRVQFESVAPLYELTIKLRNWEVWPVLMGSGFGTASIINNAYDPTVAAMNNPNAQVARMLYETGLIGSYFFVLAFIRPVELLIRELPEKKKHEFILLVLLMLGGLLAMRSATSFIYLGVFIAVFRVKENIASVKAQV